MKELSFTEVSSGKDFADDFFLAAFGDHLPEWGHHLVCFYRMEPGVFLPLCYVNFLKYENVILVGGAVTNRAGFKHVDPAHAAQIRAEGGAYFKLLKYGFEAFADRCDAFFGRAGDSRAYKVDIQAGFIPTIHQYLIVKFQKPMNDDEKNALIEKINGIGPF